ncbi:4'-phosphopantetheinyl transferase family protein [Streptomyces aureoverticillatus]|uniref:4'-phosphopantetheinyl transferase family protein n=1 Tax=Streptomyces aureoverticillatus TaxID=66871 RepID=UPI0013DBF8E1|nr:4'-phosphopantetheinyl transferase superfamily protein [Streptomyces aureoverticillatus]QIB42337.1 4'-phosphopantetheinyl transferase superfamily protein [Streptomyces aureoverticillatus]
MNTGVKDGGTRTASTQADAPPLALLARIVPEDVVCREVLGDPDGIVLHPDEQALIARSVESRRREFTTGRHCAHRALEDLGHPADSILPDAKGSPRWPSSVVGSITHCDGYRAAAVAHASRVRSIGVDAEPGGPLPDGVLEAVALPAEQRRVGEQLVRWPGVRWDRLLFSAKESIYKTWYSLMRAPLGFEEADVVFHRSEEVDTEPGAHLDTGTFTARILPPVRERGFPQQLTGRWLARDGLVLTAITLRAAPAPQAPR